MLCGSLHVPVRMEMNHLTVYLGGARQDLSASVFSVKLSVDHLEHVCVEQHMQENKALLMAINDFKTPNMMHCYYSDKTENHYEAPLDTFSHILGYCIYKKGGVSTFHPSVKLPSWFSQEVQGE